VGAVVTLAIVVGLMGAVGATARYLSDGAVHDRMAAVLPLGTLTVNVAGSLVMGFATGLFLFHGVPRASVAVVGSGFCGGFTTWSAAAWETVRLAGEGERSAALVTSMGGIAASLAAAALGLALAAL
jgi:CrcB protein